MFTNAANDAFNMHSHDLYRELLEHVSARFTRETGLHLRVATEIEFYVRSPELADVATELTDEIIPFMAASLAEIGVPTMQVEQERGYGQYEVAIRHVPDPVLAAQHTENTRLQLAHVLEDICLQADYAAKPYDNDYGSGLHVHVSLHDEAGESMLFRENDLYCPLLRHSIAGMLATLRDTMLIYAPSVRSYKRFVGGLNAPVTMSWGANNRTVALRLPESAANHKRIEHRVAGADADPFLVIAAVIAGMHYGIREQLEPPEQIFGDAALDMYHLEQLPKNVMEARSSFKQSAFVAEYLGASFQQAFTERRD